MTFFYHILSLLIAIIIVPVFTILSFFSKYKFKFLKHHFGFTPKIKKEEGKILWFYALSLGEVKAAAPILKKIHEKNLNLQIVVSVTTDSGYEGALMHLKIAENIFFHPLDCLPFTWLARSRIQPDMYVVIDTGFWPGLIDQLHKQNTSIILLNGRISHRSASGYLKAGSLFRNMFQQFNLLCMQNNNSQQTMVDLGVNPEKIEVVGDPKFDSLQLMTDNDRNRLRQFYKLEESTPVWVAGSTHAGEEEIILNAHQHLKEKHPCLVLILAPRRIERADEIAALLEKKSISYCRRSLLENSEPESVILLDTVGELAALYSLGQVVFIGHSLIEPGGGHSLIEPLSHGVAVLHGPHIENIDHVADEAHKQSVAFTVRNSEEIKEKVDALLKQKDHRRRLAAKAKSFISDQQGAAEKMATIIFKFLES